MSDYRRVRDTGLVALVLGTGIMALDPASRNECTYVPAILAGLMAYYSKEFTQVCDYFRQ